MCLCLNLNHFRVLDSNFANIDKVISLDSFFDNIDKVISLQPSSLATLMPTMPGGLNTLSLKSLKFSVTQSHRQLVEFRTCFSIKPDGHDSILVAFF